MNNKLVFAIIGVVVLLVALGVFFMRPDDSGQTTTQTNETSTNSQQAAENTAQDTEEETEQPAETVTITYTDNGFSPENYTVKSGTKVVVKNNSSNDLQFSSDDHPTHRENPELNTQTIGPGEIAEFTPKTTGTWGFHDHLNDSHTGTLMVE